MNGMFNGANIDGGTFPAQIWGQYMKKAVGKSCSDFRKPSGPFQSQPFLGHYSREGLSKDEDQDPSAEDKTNDPQAPPADTKPDTGTTDKPKNQDTTADNNDGKTYDPGAYETQPQGPPGAQAPTGGTQAPSDDG